MWILFRLVLSQNKKELLVNWWGEGKLEVRRFWGMQKGFCCSN